jgi:hypothetical protein
MTSINGVDIAFPENRTDYLPGEEWFERTYPASYRRYGAPIQLVWGPNHDALANALNEGPARIVYQAAEDRFYYLDRSTLSAYCPVEPVERLLALTRAVLQRAAEAMTRSEKIVWFQIWDEKAVRAVVDAARALLSVDHTFFHGEKSHRRFVDGNFIEPNAFKSHELFTREAVHPLPGSILTVSDAYQGYHRFCSMRKMQPLRRTTFKEEFRREAIEQFGVGLRHDLVLQQSGSKRTCQGWVDLGLGDLAKSFGPPCPADPLKSGVA